MTLSIANTPSKPGEWFVIDYASWDLYEMLLREVEEQNIRITYDHGRLMLMSPLPIHERVKKVTGRLIELAVVELNIPCACLGSTTWKNQEMEVGLEADECYCIQHELKVRTKMHFDLAVDPPPDLAVEVEITHHPMDRPSIYAALGVGEIWRFDGELMHFLKLGPDRQYHPIEISDALPMLTSAVINQYLGMVRNGNDTSVMRHFRGWLRTLPQAQ